MKHMKIIENHYKSLKIITNHYKSMEISVNHKQTLKIKENQRNQRTNIKIHYKFKKIHETHNTIKTKQVFCNTHEKV